MSVEAVGYDDEWELRRLEALANAACEPIVQLPSSTPEGISSASSIQTAPTVESIPSNSRPKLSPPRHYMLDIIDMHSDVEEITSAYLAQIEEQTKADISQIQALNQQRTEALQKHAREIAAQQTWGIWATIGQYVSTAASLVLGLGLLAGPSMVAGAFLIASGGLGLANRVLNDLGAWNAVAKYFAKSEEMEKTVAQWIDTGVYFLSVGLGLAGGILAYQAGALALSGDKVSQTLGIAGAALGAGARLGGAFAEKRALHLQANMKELESQSFDTNKQLDYNSSEAKKTIEMAATIADGVRQNLNLSEVHLD